MAKRKNSIEVSDPNLGFLNDIRVIINLLALILVKGESQTEKICMLTAAGYAPAEVASLLGITSNAARVALFKIRAKKK